MKHLNVCQNHSTHKLLFICSRQSKWSGLSNLILNESSYKAIKGKCSKLELKSIPFSLPQPPVDAPIEVGGWLRRRELNWRYNNRIIILHLVTERAKAVSAISMIMTIPSSSCSLILISSAMTTTTTGADCKWNGTRYILRKSKLHNNIITDSNLHCLLYCWCTTTWTVVGLPNFHEEAEYDYYYFYFSIY